MQPEDPSKYDFLLNPENGPKKVGPNFGSKRKQIAIGSAFAVIVLLIAGFVASLIFSSGGNEGQELITVGAHQTEIDRVITLGQKNIDSPLTKQTLGTLQATILSDSNEVISLLGKRSVEVTKAQLSSQKDSENDSALSDALVSDTHDQVLEQTVEGLATKYYSSLKEARKKAATKEEQRTLDTAMFNIETIYALN